MIEQKYVVKLSEKPTPKALNNSFISLAKYMNVGYYVIIPLFVAVAVGVALDRYLDTKPIITFVSIGFGAVSSVYNMVKLVKDIKTENVTYKH